MASRELREAFSEFLRPTRRLVLTKGDPGQLPVTKIGGAPWWPTGVERPHCPQGHAMSFITQIRLADVPGLGPNEPGLLVFHYCQECAYEGHMAFGWSSPDYKWADPADHTRYDLTIFTDLADKPADGLGTIAVDVVGPHAVGFSDRMETPSNIEASEIAQLSGPLKAADKDEIEFILQGTYGFDESKFPDLIHIPVSKLGGWPSWVQSPEWPRDYPDEPLMLAAQLSPMKGGRETWCCGELYIFIGPDPQGGWKAKMLLQDS